MLPSPTDGNIPTLNFPLAVVTYRQEKRETPQCLQMCLQNNEYHDFSVFREELTVAPPQLVQPQQQQQQQNVTSSSRQRPQT